jgi:hypothetical protein
MKLGYLLIALSITANANCRVAGNDIVCDNSNALIDTMKIINRQVFIPQQVFIVNQPLDLPDIGGVPPEYDPILIKQLDAYDIKFNSEE